MAFTYDSNGNAVLVTGGTAASPAIRIRNATNDGIYASQAGEVGVSVGGTPRFTVVANKTTVSNDLACRAYTETMFLHGFSGTSKTLVTNGSQRCTLTGNCTFAMPGVASAHQGRGVTLYLLTGAGNFTATFTGVKWPGNVAPTVTSAGGKMDIFCFVSDGFNWYGSVVQNYSI